MNRESLAKRKLILSDPVAYYASSAASDSQSTINELKALWENYRFLKESYDSIDSQTRELSKQIGFAKNSGSDCAELIQHMRQKSKEKSAFDQKLQSIESEILAVCNLDTDENKEPENTQAHLTPKDYPLRNYDSEAIDIKILDNDYTAWNAYVNKNQNASVYHLAEWRDLIKSTFGHEGIYFYAIDAKNTIRGILPLIRLKSLAFGDFLVSMPYFNYGGAIADHPDIENRLMRSASDIASRIGVSHIEYRDDISHAEYPTRCDKVNMILTLPADAQILWNSFTPKLRSQIKRPQRENPGISFGHAELLNDFYEVFARNMRDLGTPVYSKRFFLNILNTFPTQTHILTVRIKNKPVAAAFLIGYGTKLEIPWASTIRTVNHLSVNMLMYWEALNFAVTNNYDYFDFGRSTKDAGTYQFKKQWGALPRQSYWHYWLSPGKEMPSLNPYNPKYAAAIATWKRLPLFISNFLGPFIVRNLP